MLFVEVPCCVLTGVSAGEVVAGVTPLWTEAFTVPVPLRFTGPSERPGFAVLYSRLLVAPPIVLVLFRLVPRLLTEPRDVPVLFIPLRFIDSDPLRLS